MFLTYKKTKVSLLLGVAILLSGCTRSVSDVDANGKTSAAVFPDLKTATKKEGSYVNIDNLMKVKKGMTKSQLYELIGTPHFKEGIMRVKEWDYIFHQTMEDGIVTTCQYKVLFDSEMKAQSFYFLPEDCLSKLKGREKKDNVSTVDLKAEGLFIFGTAALLPDGIRKSISLAEDLKKNSLDHKRIIITGHTDRIGNKESNLYLSKQRAESVKAILVDNGIPASIIQTRGAGDNEPRVFCEGEKSDALIECLAPNRRMTINVTN
ncbi:TPA: OmpA family protein [Enterobacter cloacae]